MADTTYGFKVSTEIREKVSSMIALSGHSSKELFESVVALYEVQLYRHDEGARRFASDIEALHEHTTRINEIFASLIKRIIDDSKQRALEIEQSVLDKQNEIDELKQELHMLTTEMEYKNMEIIKLKQFEELCGTQKETILHLSAELSRLKDIVDKCDPRQLEKLTNELNSAQKELELEKLRHQNEMQQLTLEKLTNESKSTTAKKQGRPRKAQKQDDPFILENKPEQQIENLLYNDVIDEKLAE